ncbi:Protochlorophyllide reductase A- chloroplastic [Apiospora hydei]|uniref:Protochlorophyllide reductase A- chloroplastic n=1 Tax=Apiospora hydei TaxID=1337664 RepID=A0ABR1V5Z3_9PEZI
MHALHAAEDRWADFYPDAITPSEVSSRAGYEPTCMTSGMMCRRDTNIGQMELLKGSILLTGANGGLGCGIVRRIITTPELLRYHGIYFVRDAQHATALKATLANAPNSYSYQIISLDLARLPDVRGIAQDLQARIAGASVEHPHHLLDGHYKEDKWKIFFRQDNLDAIVHGQWSTNGDAVLARHAGTRRYGVAKMCAVMMVAELQRRLDADPVLKRVSIAGIDPGAMGTGLTRRSNWFTRVLLWPIVVPILALFLTWLDRNGHVRTIRKSAGDVLAAAFEAGDEVRGKLLNGSEVADVVPEAADVQKRLMVWRDSVKYAELEEQDTILTQWK